MKSVLATLGLFASFTALVAASPAADALAQLEGRDPIICIGCVTTGNCGGHSEPSGCELENNGGDCDVFCTAVAVGCRCCRFDENDVSTECWNV